MSLSKNPQQPQQAPNADQAQAKVKPWGPEDAVDEAEHYAEDVRELNRTQPGWDRESRVMAARRLLAEPGIDEATVRGIYGEAIVAEALAAAGAPGGMLASL